MQQDPKMFEGPKDVRTEECGCTLVTFVQSGAKQYSPCLAHSFEHAGKMLLEASRKLLEQAEYVRLLEQRMETLEGALKIVLPNQPRPVGLDGGRPIAQ